MGSYNSEYQSYYNSMIKQKKITNHSVSLLNKKRIIRRLIQELTGGAVLFLAIVLLKANLLPQSQYIYKYSKQTVNHDINYKKYYSDIKIVASEKPERLQSNAIDWLEATKVNYIGGSTVKNQIKSNYIVPVSGNIITNFSKSKKGYEGIDIEVNESEDIKSTYKGKVRNIGSDKKYKKFIEIDHGNGIVTKYYNIDKQLVKKNEQVKKGQVIAKLGKDSNSQKTLHFELLYMGKRINPEEYIKFK